MCGCSLTLRQKEILVLLAEGNEGKEVAAKLGIAYQTVKNHLFIMRERMDVRTTTQAVAKAIRGGLIK